MLKITYFGKTSFRLESKETSVILNPGIWDGESLVPDDHDCRVIIVTNHDDDALGNAVEIAANSKAWILGNESTIKKAGEQGGKPWLLHVLQPEVPYEIPGLRVTPFPLKKGRADSDEVIENLGLYIEIGAMKIAYLGDAMIRGPFGQSEAHIVIVPVGGDGVFEVKDAVSLTLDVRPKLAIPIRWNTEEQSAKYTKYIEQFGQGTTPVVMKEGQEMSVQWAAGHEFKYEIS
ncbi:MAG: MBL fold metallo-hydrolase [Promethearchaeota archaeon]